MNAPERAEKSGWKTKQDEIADEKEAAIVLVDDRSSEIAVSNNNSICRLLYSSEEFAPRCAEFCGKAFEIAHEAGKAVHVKCHADLDFLAVPLKIENKKIAAIVGRAFLKTEDYKKATERAISGDWQEFPPEEFFSNVLILSSVSDLEKAARRIEKLRPQEKEDLLNFLDHGETAPETEGLLTGSFHETIETIQPAAASPEVFVRNSREMEELAVWRGIFDSLINLSYAQACISILEFLSERYSLSSLAWLEPRENYWRKMFAIGELENRQIKIELASDELLREVLQAETALELRERAANELEKLQTLQMFPYSVGEKMQGAVVVGGEIKDENNKKNITRFLKNISSTLEILRLRRELERQTRLSRAVHKFNDSLKNIDADNFWSLVAGASVELMQAERGSLLSFDEEQQKFFVKAATGSHADIIKAQYETLGEKVAHSVLDKGKAVAVEDVEESEFSPAPAGWSYKTKSFISYPIKIGERTVGIFNVADKIDGGVYEQSDLELLEAFAPQIAVALDRNLLKKRAGEFEKLSITDALTGLLNRRYLEERIAEEISRSQRSGSPVSFMMLDVDEFKSYNDVFSHPEGDKALKIVGNILKETLRGADVAARYGGEEFSILLPQTTLQEAYAIAERIRENIEHREFPNRGVTVSIGVAVASPKLATPQTLISAADSALYKAKNSGRNNVQVYEESVKAISHE